MRLSRLEQAAKRTTYLAAALMLLAALPWPAEGAEDTRLQKLEWAAALDRAKAIALRRKAEKFRLEVADLREDMIAVAKKTQNLEDELSKIEQTVNILKQEEDKRFVDLKQRRKQLNGTIAALQRIAFQPPEALIAAPGLPIDIVQSAMLLRVALPAMERRAATLKTELDGLRAVRLQILGEQEGLKEARTALKAERARLTGLIERKRKVEQVSLAEQEQVQLRADRFASEAQDLRELLAKLEQEAIERAEREAKAREKAEREQAERNAKARAERVTLEEATRIARLTREQPASQVVAPVTLARPSNVRTFPSSPKASSLIMPARGRLVSRYGQRTASEGDVSKGLTIETRAAAQVVAPYDGKIAFAGEFRGYGQILIIEHGERYHTLLAGMDRIDAVAGQWVLAGEPVGVMIGTPSSKPRLYMELRRTGLPINPLPWLAATNDKVQG